MCGGSDLAYNLGYGLSFSQSNMTLVVKRIKIGISVWMTAVILAAFVLSAATKLPILEQTARNLYFHVPMWFTMMMAYFVSAYFAVQVLRTEDLVWDMKVVEATRIAMLFGVLGMLTGIVWSRFTWFLGTGKWWGSDPKQMMAAVQLLISGAYFVLRSALDNPRLRARISAVYTLFSVVSMIFLLYVLPRLTESLHPGTGGNPAFDKITDPTMRLVFYPAILGFFGIAWWLFDRRVRLARVEEDTEGFYIQ